MFTKKTYTACAGVMHVGEANDTAVVGRETTLVFASHICYSFRHA